MLRTSVAERLRYELSVPGALLLLLSLLYVPLNRGTVPADVSEILVPVAISIGLVAFSLRLRELDHRSERVQRIVAWSWRGLLASALVGGWWVLVYLTRGLPVVELSDQILTLLSFGSGAGVIAGTQRGSRANVRQRAPRERVVSETTWFGRAEKATITVAVSEVLAEIEGVEPHELDFALYDYVDPDVFETLATDGDSPWQLRFRVEEYEVRVSSHGTVTVFERNPSEERHETVELPR